MYKQKQSSYRPQTPSRNPSPMKLETDNPAYIDDVSNPPIEDYNLYDEKARRKALQKVQNNYLKILLDPFNAKVCRVPVDIPFQSHLISDKTTFQVNIGTAGDLFGVFCPGFALRQQGNPFGDWYFTSRNTTAPALTATTSDTLLELQALANGAGAANYAANISGGNQGFNYGTYFKSVRLVAAGLKIKYIGRLDATSGYILCGAQVENKSPNTQTIPTIDKLNEYMFAKKFKLTQEMQTIWFPIDESAKIFANLNATQYGSAETLYSFLQYNFYGSGLPAGQALDIEIVRHYECIPNADYTELFGMVGGKQAPTYQMLIDEDEERKNPKKKMVGMANPYAVPQTETENPTWTRKVYDHAMQFIGENIGDWAVRAVETVEWGDILETGLMFLGLL